MASQDAHPIQNQIHLLLFYLREPKEDGLVLKGTLVLHPSHYHHSVSSSHASLALASCHTYNNRRARELQGFPEIHQTSAWPFPGRLWVPSFPHHEPKAPDQVSLSERFLFLPAALSGRLQLPPTQTHTPHAQTKHRTRSYPTNNNIIFDTTSGQNVP